MLFYPNMLARYRPDDLASYVWISIEEVRRFNLTLYKVYSMVSRPSNRGFSANDLQYPMSKNDSLWNTVNKEEWLSAWPGDLNFLSLDDALEDEWISNSAELIGLFG